MITYSGSIQITMQQSVTQNLTMKLQNNKHSESLCRTQLKFKVKGSQHTLTATECVNKMRWPT